jgi:glycosyltransferase involved in cell wall biosynthesis
VNHEAPARIRLLQIVGNAIVGGMERYVSNLVERLPQSHFEITCLCPFESAFSQHLRRQGCAMYFTPISDEPSWHSIQFACSLVRSLRIQVIHAHLANAHLLASLCSAVTGARTLATLHGRSVGAMDFEIYRLGHSQLSVVCQNAQLHALSLGAAARDVHWIPNGVGTALPIGVPGVLQRELGLPAETPLVGFVGRLAPEKGPQHFLRMAAQVCAGHPTAHCVVVGEGPLRAELQAFALGNDHASRIHFLGARHDMDEVYASLAVLALTSESEGMPLALMEAMAAGVAVVAANVGGVAEIVSHEETGLLVPPRQAEAAARAVLTLLADGQRRNALGMAARQRIATHFSLDRSAEAMAGVLTMLAGLHPPLHAVASRYRA